MTMAMARPRLLDYLSRMLGQRRRVAKTRYQITKEVLSEPPMRQAMETMQRADRIYRELDEIERRRK